MARGGREGAAQKDEEVELKSPGATMCSMAMGAYALECTSVRYLDDYFNVVACRADRRIGSRGA